MKIHDVQQNTPEWFALRLGKFTASDAQAIANNGKGLETLVYEKVAELLTGKFKEEYTNADIERGKELEEMARNSYELETQKLVKKVGFVEKSERVGCSPDGFIAEDGLQEIKCLNNANFVKFMYLQQIDPAHEWQMQMQMLVCERQYCDYVIFNPNFEKPVIITKVLRDEAMIEKLRIGLEEAQRRLEAILVKIK
jgi:putative phage-type endonuclease